MYATSLDLQVISSKVWYLEDRMAYKQDAHVPSWVPHSICLYLYEHLLQLVLAAAFSSHVQVVRLLY